MKELRIKKIRVGIGKWVRMINIYGILCVVSCKCWIYIILLNRYNIFVRWGLLLFRKEIEEVRRFV